MQEIENKFYKKRSDFKKVIIKKIISTSLFLDSLSPSSAPAVTNVAFGSITVPAPVVQVSPRVVKQFQIVSGVWTYITEAFV